MVSNSVLDELVRVKAELADLTEAASAYVNLDWPDDMPYPDWNDLQEDHRRRLLEALARASVRPKETR